MVKAVPRTFRHTIALLAAILLAAPPMTPAAGARYHLLDPDLVIRGRAAPGPVRVRGPYFPYGDYQELVRGVIVLGDYALRVEGEVFDWRPPPGAGVEFWGELVHDGTGYMLRFHNGRGLRESNRTPRPTPLLAPGLELELRLKTAQTASQPFPLASGRTEDGFVFTLPPSFTGPWGVVCLHGIAEPLGQGWRLREVQACEE